jgi:phage baseplate assembly protein W
MSNQHGWGQEYLGKGLAFPLQMNARGELALAGGARDIEQSLRIILGTRPGERVMRPAFGCRVHDLLFEPLNAATKSLMQQYVMEAVTMWEPRVELLAVDVYVDQEMAGALLIEIHYHIKETHDERSIVYPFFLLGEEEW